MHADTLNVCMFDVAFAAAEAGVQLPNSLCRDRIVIINRLAAVRNSVIMGRTSNPALLRMGPSQAIGPSTAENLAYDCPIAVNNRRPAVFDGFFSNN
jgi:hypothetical protein